MLVDAGPLVALLDQSDPHHAASVAALTTFRDPLVTVWPAFTEAMYLLGSSWRGQKALWSRLEAGSLMLAQLDEGDAPRMRELMEKYRDLPMDLADAALVRVAEREDLTRIFTLDRRHFSVYRPGRRRRFSILQGKTAKSGDCRRDRVLPGFHSGPESGRVRRPIARVPKRSGHVAVNNQ